MAYTGQVLVVDDGGVVEGERVDGDALLVRHRRAPELGAERGAHAPPFHIPHLLPPRASFGGVLPRFPFPSLPSSSPSMMKRVGGGGRPPLWRRRRQGRRVARGDAGSLLWAATLSGSRSATRSPTPSSFFELFCSVLWSRGEGWGKIMKIVCGARNEN